MSGTATWQPIVAILLFSIGVVLVPGNRELRAIGAGMLLVLSVLALVGVAAHTVDHMVWVR